MHNTLARFAKLELEFLLKRQPIPVVGAARPVPEERPLELNKALDLLKKVTWSPRKSGTPPASKIFQQFDGLYSLPEANGLLIRDYVKWNDFSTAHAFILKSIDRLNVTDINYFLMKSFSASENSKHLVSVFEAAVKQFPQDAAHIAAFTLVGLRLLQENSQYDRIKKWCHRQGLDRSLPMLQVQLFGLYLERRYDEALELSRTIKSRAPATPHIDLMFPYRWATLYASRKGDLKIFGTINTHLKDLDFNPTKSMSNMTLSHLPEIFPDISPLEWLAQWKKNQWPLTATSVLIMVDHLARRMPQIGSKIWARSDKLIEKYRSAANSRQRPVPLLRGRHSPFLQQLRSSLYDEPNLEYSIKVLETLNRNGIVPSYDYYVHLSEALVKNHNDQQLQVVKSQMQATNYPLHCAGIDLSVLERQLRELNPDTPTQQQQLSQLLIQDYLVQYPLSVHDIVHLTRIAYLHKHYIADGQSAEHVLEFRRMCTPGQCFSATNHDKESLTLLLEVGNMNPDEWIIKILADDPDIVFDFKFRRSLSIALKQHQMEGLREPLLKKVRQHNSKVIKRTLDQVEKMYSILI